MELKPALPFCGGTQNGKRQMHVRWVKKSHPGDGMALGITLAMSLYETILYPKVI